MPLQAELIHVLQRLSSSRDMQSVISVLREVTRRLTGADGISVVLRDGDHCHYIEEDAIAPLWKGRRFPVSDCISGWCMLHGQAVSLPDIYADPRVPHQVYRETFVKSLAVAPIRSQQPLGAISAYWAKPPASLEPAVEILRSLGDSAALAIANIQLIEQLRDANHRKDQFLAMLAHELRNPMTPLRNALELMERAEADPEILSNARKMMVRQVRHLAHILEDLLDAARLQNGKIQLRPQRMDLSRVVRQAAEDRRGVLEAAGLSLRIEVPAAPVFAKCDSTRVAQILDNILDNARKFTRPGGEVILRLSVDAVHRQAVVSVRDTGIGIAPELLARIFDVFEQADESLDRAGGGLGLGLPLAKGLLELHGGGIRAASAGVGKGAEFSFFLPCEIAPPMPAVPPAGAISGEARKMVVLVIEDNRDAADSMRLLLKLSGYESHAAYSGIEGRDAALRLRPNVVLCDIGLPELDGYSIARTLRAAPETSETRLIAVSGYGRDEDRERAVESGFDAHLTKPVDFDTLLEELSRISATPAVAR